MKAAVIPRPGAPEVLEIREVPTPSPQADQILVRVHASALNRADLLQRRGLYPAPPGFPEDIPGMEFAGEVAALGANARMWRIGQRVFGITGGGAHAEFVIAQERTVAEIPESLNWTEAASVPEVFLTAYDALWLQAGIRPGESVLIPAIGSGVGLAALQLVCAMNGVAYGTSRTEDKLARAREFGLEHGGVASNGAELLSHAERWGQKGKFAVVLELVGGDYVPVDIEVLGSKGRLILVGTMAGGSTQIKLSMVLGKRLKIIGTALRSRALEEKIAVTQSFAAEVCPLFALGKLRPTVDSVFALDRIAEAHERMEANLNFGKIVIEVGR